MPYLLLLSSGLIMSTMMAISSNNWIFIWVAMELNMLSFIPMIILSQKNTQKAEASVKYFLAQALGSAMMLFSSMLLLSNSPQMLSIFLCSSILLKLGAAPFHLWYPSVMTSMSWMNCLILSSWQKLAPFFIVTFVLSLSSNKMLIFAAGLSAIIGGVMGMKQTHMRTILAYSSIGHIGWMLSLLSVNLPMKSVTYYIFYVILITPLFFMMNLMNITSYQQLSSSKKHMLLMSTLMMLLLFSLGGLPPLTGFLPKLMALSALITNNMMLTMALVLGSVLNLYYYLMISLTSLISSLTIKAPNLTYHKNLSLLILMSMFSLFLTPILIYALTFFY